MSKLKELFRNAKKGAKNASHKNLRWAIICGIAIVALIIWEIITLAGLFG